MATSVTLLEEGVSFFTQFFTDILTNPVNFLLASVCLVLVYKIIQARRQANEPARPQRPQLPPLKKRDMTPEELSQFDGQNSEGRVCVAVNWKIFDVTRGKRFYGPGGPYEILAGKDASRALGTFTMDSSAFKPGYDDLADLTSSEMDGVREWEEQFREKYDFVGKLLRPGEEPSEYDDSEPDEDAANEGTSDNRRPKVD